MPTIPSVYDQTCETLTGSTIQSARRDGIWLVLQLTDKTGRTRELHFSGRATKASLYCPHCGEDRMVEIIQDSRGKEGCCAVCGKHWRAA